MYASGIGAEQNSERAVFWFLKAVDQEYENAQSNLAWFYSTIIYSEESSTSTLMERFDITDNLVKSILDFKLRYRNKFEELNYLLAGQSNDWYVYLSPSGYGCRVKLKELISENKVIKLPIALPGDQKALKPMLIHNESDLLAVVTLKGRLLIFSVSELASLKENSSSKLIDIPIVDLFSGEDYVVSAVIMPENSKLLLYSGRRHLTLKDEDIKAFSGSCAERGICMPRGFQRDNRLEFD